MKVIFFLYRFPQVSETFILSQITGLIDRDCEVQIVSVEREPTAVVHQAISDYGLLDRTVYLTELAKPRWSRSLQQAASRPGLAIRSAQAWRYGYKSINRVLLNLASCWLASEAEQRPDAVVANYAHIGDLAVCLRSLGVFTGPVIVPVHGLDIACRIAQGKPIYPPLRRYGDLVLPISRRWEAELLRDGYQRQRVDVHHVGVTVHDLPPSRLDPRPPGELRLLSVCRFVEKKGLIYALRALRKLMDQADLDFHYALIGDGPEADTLRHAVQNLGLASKVSFTGFLSQESIRSYYRNHQIFLAPSVTAANGDQEGIPTALMEAMAEGLLVISTTHSGIPELIDHGISGLLTPERDVDALAQAITSIAGTPERWPQMRKAAWQKVNDQFNIQKLNDRLLCRLRQLAEQHPR